MEEMDDRELHEILKKWEAPAAPPSLKGIVLHHYRQERKWDWRRLFTGSVQVPVPVACLAVLAFICISAAAMMPKTPPPPVPPQIIEKIVNVPVVQERVVTRTVYRERTTARSAGGINLKEFQPVASLVPRIIRSHQNENQN